MSIRFACSSCHTKLRAKPELAGKRTKCPKCSQSVTIPQQVALAHEQQTRSSEAALSHAIGKYKECAECGAAILESESVCVLCKSPSTEKQQGKYRKPASDDAQLLEAAAADGAAPVGRSVDQARAELEQIYKVYSDRMPIGCLLFMVGAVLLIPYVVCVQIVGTSTTAHEIAFGVLLGSYLLLVLLQIFLPRPHKKIARERVAEVERKNAISQEAALELMLSNRNSVQLGALEGFILNVWGPAALVRLKQVMEPIMEEERKKALMEEERRAAADRTIPFRSVLRISTGMFFATVTIRYDMSTVRDHLLVLPANRRIDPDDEMALMNALAAKERGVDYPLTFLGSTLWENAPFDCVRLSDWPLWVSQLR